jgi:hypothetical protein
MPLGDIGEYGRWITPDNMETFHEEMSNDVQEFEGEFSNRIQESTFVPLEVKISLAFIKALTKIDSVLQNSLVRFTIMFLFAMYAFWVALEAYKLIRDSTDYKKVLYDIFTKGIKIAVWILILGMGLTKIFTTIMSPIIGLSVHLSDFILNAVAQSQNVATHDPCTAIRSFVVANNTGQTLIDSNTAANIMCLPGRLSVFFYYAVGAAWSWMKSGFFSNLTAVIVGLICVVLFIKCIFKYAFMTLGVVADLVLTLLMLPFTAIAESMPSTSENNYMGQILSGFLKVFNTKKLSDVISVFINAAIYFVSLSIIIAICASLLSNIIDISSTGFSLETAMITILCGCLVLFLANKTDELAKKIGGSVNNSIGEQLHNDAKTLWNKTKDLGGIIYKDWIKGS